MSDRGMLGVTEHLRQRGFHVVRFNFPYREKGSRRPDPMPNCGVERERQRERHPDGGNRQDAGLVQRGRGEHAL